MILRDLQDFLSKEKRRSERAKTAQKFAVGVGIAAAAGLAAGILFALKSGKKTREDLKNKSETTADAIRDTVRKKAEIVNATTAHAAQGARNVIENVHRKTDGVKKDIKDGRHKITQDIHKTTENILNEPDKPVN